MDRSLKTTIWRDPKINSVSDVFSVTHPILRFRGTEGSRTKETREPDYVLRQNGTLPEGGLRGLSRRRRVHTSVKDKVGPQDTSTSDSVV